MQYYLVQECTLCTFDCKDVFIRGLEDACKARVDNVKALHVSACSKSRLILTSWFYLSGTGSPGDLGSAGHSSGGRKMVVACSNLCSCVFLITMSAKMLQSNHVKIMAC